MPLYYVSKHNGKNIGILRPLKIMHFKFSFPTGLRPWFLLEKFTLIFQMFRVVRQFKVKILSKYGSSELPLQLASCKPRHTPNKMSNKPRDSWLTKASFSVFLQLTASANYKLVNNCSVCYFSITIPKKLFLKWMYYLIKIHAHLYINFSTIIVLYN